MTRSCEHAFTQFSIHVTFGAHSEMHCNVLLCPFRISFIFLNALCSFKTSLHFTHTNARLAWLGMCFILEKALCGYALAYFHSLCHELIFMEYILSSLYVDALYEGQNGPLFG